MKLVSLYLDDVIVVPKGKDLGGGSPRTDLRDSSFQAADGWQITQVSPGLFSLFTEGMPHAVMVGGYGYTYVPEPALEDETLALLARSERKGRR